MDKLLGSFSGDNFWLALCVALIAFLQWRTSEKQRKQDLFDIRLEFYKRLKNTYLSLSAKKEAGANPYLEPEDLFPLTSEAKWLFGKDLAKAISDMQGLELDETDSAFENLPFEIEKIFEKDMKI